MSSDSLGEFASSLAGMHGAACYRNLDLSTSDFPPAAFSSKIFDIKIEEVPWFQLRQNSEGNVQ